tara:strand:- start:28 stop:864 length:837 start_codon:yes stop_codon:yes gene_type:complete
MRYQYSSRGFRQNLRPNPLSLPNGVKLLIMINIAVFILMELTGQKNVLFQIFGLVPRDVVQEYKLWQLSTYLFIHGGFFHILFNMFILWMFGKDLEVDWSKNEFLIFYFVCGIGSGIISVLASINSFVPIVGASGAIYGVLVAYGFTYPNRMVYLYGVFPLKVKYMVLGLGVIAFFASLSASQSNVSHITHLSGMIIGLIYILLNFKLKNIRLWYIKMRLKSIQGKQSYYEDDESHIKMQVDKILDKLNEHGWESITSKEEEFLTRASKRLFNDRSVN